MSTINKKQVKSRKEITMERTSHKNHMGGYSWDIKNPIHKLRIAASSCFFGEPKYYVDMDSKPGSAHGTARDSETLVDATKFAEIQSILGEVSPAEWRTLTPKQTLERTIDEALSFNLEATLQEAVRLRSEDNIRVTPQVIMVRAANRPESKETGLIRKYNSQVLQRVDDAVIQLAYQLEAFKKPIPNSLKKSWRSFIMDTPEEVLAKYRMENKEVKLIDLVRLTHPVGEKFTKLVKNELVLSGTTWESIISTEGSNAASWSKAIDVMGHMALLRNLRNISQKTDVQSQRTVAQKLVQGAPRGRQLPFRYLSAHNALKEINASPVILDAVEESLKISIGNLPKFSGRVMSLCDNSGSAQNTTTSSMGTMKMSHIANLTAVLTGMTSEEGYIGVFGDKLEVLPVRKTASIFDQVNKAEEVARAIGQATENGIWLFWDNAIRNKEHWDHIFVYSDMQAGHGGLYGINPSKYRSYLWDNTGRMPNIHVPKLIDTYRKQVNPNVKVYLVQVAGYTDTIVPEFFKNTYILGGWGDGILRFAASMSQENITQVNEQKTQVQHSNFM